MAEDEAGTTVAQTSIATGVTAEIEIATYRNDLVVLQTHQQSGADDD